MAVRFSIRYKFLLLTTFLLGFCVVSYLYLATFLFKSDKTEVVFDYNRSLVTNLASDLNSLLKSSGDKVKLLALLSKESAKKQKRLVADIMQNNEDIVFVATSRDMARLDPALYRQEEFLQTYALEPDFFEKSFSILSMSSNSMPIDVLKKKGEVVWNTSISGRQPVSLMGYMKLVTEENTEGQAIGQFAIFALIKPDRILSSIRQSQLNDVVVVTSNGTSLFEDGAGRKIEDFNGLFQKLNSESVRTRVLKFTSNGQPMLGAYSKAFNDQVYILSQVSEAKAFSVVNRLLWRSLLFASIVVTLAFLVAIVFSRSLTRPIEVLVGGMKKVAEGDLDGHIDVRSKDEIAVLAKSFNLMIRDLKNSREELREINLGLEQKVKDRTIELEKQNQAVKDAQEALLESSKLAAIGEIAGQAAHEVLNPLTTIISRIEKMQNRMHRHLQDHAVLNAQILSSWESDVKAGGFEALIKNWKAPSSVIEGYSLWQEDIENLKTIQQKNNDETQQILTDAQFLFDEGQRISRIVNQMRSLSATAKITTAISLQQTIEKAAKIMADSADKCNVQFVFDFKASEDRVLMDEAELIQVLTNLIRNSIQALEHKDINQGANRLISFKTYSEQNKIFVEIEDNGQGLSDESQRNLFYKQFSTKSRSDGTGLGLKISRRFIRGSQGDLYLKKSILGEGSAFCFELPIDRNARQERQSA